MPPRNSFVEVFSFANCRMGSSLESDLTSKTWSNPGTCFSFRDKGFCDNNLCAFSHVLRSETTIYSVIQNECFECADALPPKINTKDIPCTMFPTCNLGPTCPYSHDFDTYHLSFQGIPYNMSSVSLESIIKKDNDTFRITSVTINPSHLGPKGWRSGMITLVSTFDCRDLVLSRINCIPSVAKANQQAKIQKIDKDKMPRRYKPCKQIDADGFTMINNSKNGNKMKDKPTHQIEVDNIFNTVSHSVSDNAEEIAMEVAKNQIRDLEQAVSYAGTVKNDKTPLQDKKALHEKSPMLKLMGRALVKKVTPPSVCPPGESEC